MGCSHLPQICCCSDVGDGGASTAPKIWIVETLGKIPENLGKNDANSFSEKQLKTFFWRSHQKEVFVIFVGENL